jgi:hypothetical protein
LDLRSFFKKLSGKNIKSIYLCGGKSSIIRNSPNKKPLEKPLISLPRETSSLEYPSKSEAPINYPKHILPYCSYKVSSFPFSSSS